MRKLTKRKRVKRSKTNKKYRGGGPVDFVKSVASTAVNTISNAGSFVVSSVVSSVNNTATGILNTAKGVVRDKTQLAIQALNNPVAEAKAEHAIDEAGVLATKLTNAVKTPIQHSVNNTIDVAEKAAAKAGPAMVRAGIDFVEAVPVLGTVVLLTDEVNQLVKIGDAGLKVAATAAEGVGEVAQAVKEVIDDPTSVVTPMSSVAPTSAIAPTSLDTSVSSSQPPRTTLDATTSPESRAAPRSIPGEPNVKQYGGLIRKRKSILRRIDRSVRKFTSGMKKNKTRRVKFTGVYPHVIQHNTFY